MKSHLILDFGKVFYSKSKKHQKSLKKWKKWQKHRVPPSDFAKKPKIRRGDPMFFTFFPCKKKDFFLQKQTWLG